VEKSQKHKIKVKMVSRERLAQKESCYSRVGDAPGRKLFSPAISTLYLYLEFGKQKRKQKKITPINNGSGIHIFSFVFAV